jgi:hypothetical protein
MALLKTLPDPFGGPDLADCYCRWGDLVLSPRTRTAEARAAGRAPLPIPLEFRIGPTAVPAQYGPPPLLAPAVLDDAGNEVTPAQYGPPPLLAPAVPSYDEFSAGLNGTADQPGLADGLGAIIYGFAKQQPALADAADV